VIIQVLTRPYLPFLLNTKSTTGMENSIYIYVFLYIYKYIYDLFKIAVSAWLCVGLNGKTTEE
jgi:hypothetical protein